MNDSFVFYESFLKAGNRLKPELQLKYFKAIFEYAFYGKETETDETVLSMLDLIKPQLEANKQKRKNGSLGGRPTIKNLEEEPVVSEEKPMVIDNENHRFDNEKPNVNVNVNVNGNEDKRESIERKSFEPPSLSQVEKVCEELGFDKSIAASFYNYYSANGWMQGKDKPILNWVAQLNVWVARQHEFEKPSKAAKDNSTSVYRERRYSDEDMDRLFDSTGEDTEF